MYGVMNVRHPVSQTFIPNTPGQDGSAQNLRQRTIHRTAQSNQNFMNFVSYFEYL